MVENQHCQKTTLDTGMNDVFKDFIMRYRPDD
jgi:hypothetical protein